MAPSAIAEALPALETSHAHPAFPLKATVNASVLHGPRDVRLVQKSRAPSYLIYKTNDLPGNQKYRGSVDWRTSDPDQVDRHLWIRCKLLQKVRQR